MFIWLDIILGDCDVTNSPHPHHEPVLYFCLQKLTLQITKTCCSVAKSCLTVCNPMDCSTPGFPIHHFLLELAQTQVHLVSDAIYPSHPLLPSSAFNISQHQGLLSQWVSSLHQVAKVLELQLQHQLSSEYSELISFRIDWFDFIAVQGILKSLLQHHNLPL